MEKFTTVREAANWLDIPATHTKVKNGLGVANLTRQGDGLRDAEDHAIKLLGFIESGQVLQELAASLADNGVIDFDDHDGELMGDYFDSVIALKGLHASWTRRAVTSPR
jgi:hypothetical protein